MVRLSVVLATKNEESNIGACLESVKGLFADLPAQAGEIVVYDEFSTDKTREIAKKYGARVFKYKHKTNFHQTKQRAINKATGDWILQLDADERVTPELAEEIRDVINSNNEKLQDRILTNINLHTSSIKHLRLFFRHQHLIEEREGKLGKPMGETTSASRQVVALFIPRLNFFLGKPLIHAGVYPDGVIRLFKKGRARLPGNSVHELMEVDGEVGWLYNDLEHHESPTFSRYLDRANRYTDLTAEEFKKKRLPTNALFMIHYSLFKPLFVFIKLYFMHKGFSDGMRGFIWSSFSALHYPLAYFKYYQSRNK